MELPITPYKNTGGYVTQPASQARAEHDVASGKLADRQSKILAFLDRVPFAGLTWKELAEYLQQHHGTVSGALSNLHKAGLVFMLREKRDGSHPYVATKFRHQHPDNECIDEPTQTAANRYRAQLLTLMTLIEHTADRGWQNKDKDQLVAVAEWIRTNYADNA